MDKPHVPELFWGKCTEKCRIWKLLCVRKNICFSSAEQKSQCGGYMLGARGQLTVPGSKYHSCTIFIVVVVGHV